MTTPTHRDPPDRSMLDLRLAPAALAVWVVALALVRAPAWCAVATAGAAAVALVLLRALGTSTSRLSLTLLCGAVVLVALSTGGRVAARESGGLREAARDGATVELRGTVRSVTALASGAPGTARVVVALDATRADGDDPWTATGAAVQMFIPDAPALGSRIELTARLAPSRSASDRALATARPLGEIRVRAGPDPVTALLADRRVALVDIAAALPGDAGALIPAVAVGDMSAVGELDAIMRASGLAHLTAVSGAHFSMVGVVVLALSSWCGVPRRWRWSPVVIVSVGFVMLVGPGPTVVRAALMGGVGVLGVGVGRPSRAVPALCASVLTLLVADPWLCADLGFLLSVVATAGITLLAGPLAGRLGSALPRTVAMALAVPVAAQAACAPVILLIDPAVPLYAIPANIVVAPAVGPATIGGLCAAMLAGWCPWAADWAAAVAGTGCWWIGAVARVAVALPGARVSWLAGWPGLLTLATATGTGLALLLRCRRAMAP
ncbi:ComEC/Rec2 family competence protein [Cellulomonas sp. NPDC089187]|uniref:ComEC/Rec2 family competence protein n=1 Tax=Cellulomonas sp. NPDC089187 TaxID=3154970 RepID=UPI00341FEDB6